MTGLVANYEFEGDFSYFSGNGHNGIANSNPLIIEGHEKGIATAPGGDNSYIDILLSPPSLPSSFSVDFNFASCLLRLCPIGKREKRD